jgi:hypothetical protein
VDEFRANGRLPGTTAELFERGCVALCSEVNPSRIESGAVSTLGPRDLLRASELIAAAGLLANASTFQLPTARRPADEPNVLDTDRLADTVSRLPIPGRAFSSADLRQALSTGLFSARGESHLGWAHATYESFLAARFLVQQLSTEQIENLLLRRDADGRYRAIPQLQDCVAWVGALDERVRARLLTDDPETLMKMSIAPLNDREKAMAVETLLRFVEAKKLFDWNIDQPLRYEQLRHPSLSAQLRPVLVDTSLSVAVRRMALDIAEECNLTDLAGTITDVALDRSQPHAVRQEAAHALLKIADQNCLERLRPLTQTEAVDDPDDQLRGNAIRALWRGGQLGPEVWDLCTEPRKKHFFGAYVVFLSSPLPKSLERTEHVVAALKWAERRSTGELKQDFTMRQLEDKVLAAAWAHGDDPEVMKGLAAVVCGRMMRYEAPLGSADLPLSDHPNRQLALLESVLGLGAAKGLTVAHLFSGRGDLTEDLGFETLLGRAAALDAPASTILARLARLRYPLTSSALDAVLELSKVSRAVQDEFQGFVGPVDLHSPLAEQMRREYQEYERATQRRESANEERPAPLPFGPLLAEHLDAFDAGELDRWWRLNAAMSLWPPESARDEFEADPENLPVWATLSEAQRLRVISAADRYLREFRVSDQQAVDGASFFRPAAAGVRALVLVLHHAPAQYAALTRECWERWAASLAAYGTHELELAGDDRKLLADAYRASPSRMTEVIKQVLVDRDKRSRNVYGHSQLVACGDPQLSVELATWCLQAGLTAESQYAVLLETLPHVSDVRAHSRYISDAGVPRDNRVAVASALLRIRAGEAWKALWQLLNEDETFAREVLARATDFPDHKLASALVSQLPALSVVDMHRLVARLAPPERDAEHEGMHAIGPTERLTWLRSGLLTALQAKGTEDAVSALRDLARGSDEAWHYFLALNADRARIQAEWSGLDPGSLIRLCSDKSKRVVETEAQLLGNRPVIDVWRG